ncbi:hypothetical protein PANG_00058 [Paenibacillus phage PG1]|uniref:hypothetical protein n=1 Tax=Paenibacillus phage PG1 TaxID=754053 RepID=UPI0003425C61|nr:hypothetical protein PANG_00058 [Paenibacillus phage PG1]AGN33777.1 hypothetical protein PANG_00058 [Paenibacillus phage PG1]
MIKKLICALIGHRWAQHTYVQGNTYTGKHCWRCKKGLPANAHIYMEIRRNKDHINLPGEETTV